MILIRETDPPEDRLISPFAEAEGHYADAFYANVKAEVPLETFIEAFYTGRLFRVERQVLRFAARRPSSDADVAALARGEAETFAVWSVEARRPKEILLADKSGRTKSWLCVEPTKRGTRLWFGSVIVPVKRRGKLVLGPVFDRLVGFHKLYSRLLLAAATRKARRNPR